ncbi:beta-hydroxyacyl-ACP dehydratase [Solwaraspora sp. WMMD1047]|uniref:3-hydroxyacyl-ACP dehydratase FabZ family protein n=1 Tax=Solwaraspora sp. WMMD1047 TaxID=3016102 RepID=UPI00241725F8|nr:beta-hydroxyacyl-ACP dehydratase [Solwaraspora sp. WMMD1047]MDG4831711.1 beta-hydroxyacyl-ACP dehydratase [Solwaraspora sp. WMMD1047]
MNIADIRALLPHRYPMLLVDQVHDVQPGEWLVASKAVTANEPCYAGLPEGATDHAYPASLLIESWCQAAGVLTVLGRPNPDVLTGQVTLFAAIADLELVAPVWPGDVLRHRVLAQKIVSDAAVLEGESTVDGRQVLRVGRIIIALRPASELGPTAGREPG